MSATKQAVLKSQFLASLQSRKNAIYAPLAQSRLVSPHAKKFHEELLFKLKKSQALAKPFKFDLVMPPVHEFKFATATTNIEPKEDFFSKYPLVIPRVHEFKFATAMEVIMEEAKKNIKLSAVRPEEYFFARYPREVAEAFIALFGYLSLRETSLTEWRG